MLVARRATAAGAEHDAMRRGAMVACRLMKMKRFNERLTSTHLLLESINFLSSCSEVTYGTNINYRKQVLCHTATIGHCTDRRCGRVLGRLPYVVVLIDRLIRQSSFQSRLCVKKGFSCVFCVNSTQLFSL